MSNVSLTAARAAKNDEFYTQYHDIEAEMNAYVEHEPDVFRDRVVLCPCDDPEWSNFTRYFAANFDHLGLRKLISTSYARGAANRQPTLFESVSPSYDESLHADHGRIYVLDRDSNADGRIDLDDLSFSYLEGDGDFRSDEVTRLRDEADVIVTNPPFSLFREFLAWVMEGGKRFSIIGSINAVTYKEVFPLLMQNKMWIGDSIHSGDRKFHVPDDYPLDAASCGVDPDGRKWLRVKGVRWFTNLDYGARHEPLQLMDMRQNLKFNKRLRKKLERDYGRLEYPRYDNYDAIEVPFTECIPSDYYPGYLVPVRYRDELAAAGFSLGAELPNSAGEACVLVYDGPGWDASEIGRGGGASLSPSSGSRDRDGADLRRDGCPDHLPGQVQSRTVRDRGCQRLSARQSHEAQAPRANKGQGGQRGEPYVHHLRSYLDSPQDLEWCNGVMGVPITFLDKYDSRQFDLLWLASGHSKTTMPDEVGVLVGFRPEMKSDVNTSGYGIVGGRQCYHRILIRRNPAS